MFSQDRWLILKISEDLTGLTEITEDCLRTNKNMIIESDESYDY